MKTKQESLEGKISEAREMVKWDLEYIREQEHYLAEEHVWRYQHHDVIAKYCVRAYHTLKSHADEIEKDIDLEKEIIVKLVKSTLDYIDDYQPAVWSKESEIAKIKRLEDVLYLIKEDGHEQFYKTPATELVDRYAFSGKIFSDEEKLAKIKKVQEDFGLSKEDVDGVLYKLITRTCAIFDPILLKKHVELYGLTDTSRIDKILRDEVKRFEDKALYCSYSDRDSARGYATQAIEIIKAHKLDDLAEHADEVMKIGRQRTKQYHEDQEAWEKELGMW